MEPLRQQVINMQRRVNDLLDKPSDPVAGRLKSEIQGLEDDMQGGKNVYTIEDRVKRIINLLGGEARTVMDVEHANMLRQWFENLRSNLQRLR